jgi:hypothetical protein
MRPTLLCSSIPNSKDQITRKKFGGGGGRIIWWKILEGLKIKIYIFRVWDKKNIFNPKVNLNSFSLEKIYLYFIQFIYLTFEVVRRLLGDRLPTKTNLSLRRCLHNDLLLCSVGCGYTEDLNHLFLKWLFSIDLEKYYQMVRRAVHYFP